MRLFSASSLAVTVAAILLLPACGGSTPSEISLVPHAASPSFVVPRHRRVTHAVAQPYVYVADTGFASGSTDGVIDVLHTGNYRELGYFTAGIDLPLDVFLDFSGNLYVVNYVTQDVTEYAPSKWGAPAFTYDTDTYLPQAVAVDLNGNVYVSDSDGYVGEYYQARNHTVEHCLLPEGYSTSGVAVDSAGDVFASGENSSYGSAIFEYKGGLTGCKATKLAVSGNGTTGLAVDKKSNLILADGSNVEVVDAPNYNAVNATIGSGFTCAARVHLNKPNTLAFVTDTCNDTVTVVDYQTGKNELVMGANYGLSQPTSAVEQPNAVY